jgi:hypothetical protein
VGAKTAEFQLFILNFDLGLEKGHPALLLTEKNETLTTVAHHQSANVTTVFNWIMDMNHKDN